MRSIIAVLFLVALLFPGTRTVIAEERLLVIALNPQPEPPSVRARAKRTDIQLKRMDKASPKLMLKKKTKIRVNP